MEDVDEEGSDLGFKCICGFLVFITIIIMLIHEVTKN